MDRVDHTLSFADELASVNELLGLLGSHLAGVALDGELNPQQSARLNFVLVEIERLHQLFHHAIRLQGGEPRPRLRES